MRLTDLKPRWLNENVFTFMCPHCVQGGRPRPFWLLCKNVTMSLDEQFDAFYGPNGLPRGDGIIVVPMRESANWTWTSRDFESMTVTPSIDASPSGDWHGFIREGRIE